MALMKAVQIHKLGDISVLKYEDVIQPQPRSGEVLVKVHAAGINPVDWVSRKTPIPITTGSKELPYILGWDIAGEVVALGEGVTQFAVGDAVYGMPRFPGEAQAYSEYITSPEGDLAIKPSSLTYEQAAGVPLAALTAWQALFEAANLQPGQTLLVTGGSGGVGHFAIQLAKWRGARVITTTSTGNVDFVRGLGADVVIDYTKQSLDSVTEPIDAVLDTRGEDVLRAAFKAVKRSGVIISIPGQKGVRAVGAELSPQYGVDFDVILVHPSHEQLTQIAHLFDTNHLQIHIDTTYPLAEVAQAHQQGEQGHVRGKLVLTM